MLKILKQPENLIEKEIQNNKSLGKLVSECQQRIKTHSEPLTDILNHAAAETKTVMKSTSVGWTARIVQPVDVVQHIQSKLQKAYGQVAEQTSLQRLPGVTQNNTRFFLKPLYKEPALTLCIGGRIDGLQNGKLIEIKNRKSKFITPLPQYDIIQLHCYMFMLDQVRGYLIEHLQNQQEKITILKWDPSLWSTIFHELINFARVFHSVIHNESWQCELLQCKTQNEQRAVFFKSTKPCQ